MMNRGWLVVALLFVALCAGPGAALIGCRTAERTRAPATLRAAPLPLLRPVRGVWVARFHYRHPDDVRTIIRNCAEIGCNTVYWQVRGQGTVAYPSRIEPWSGEYEHRDPGFDPLAIAVAEAHRHGLRIEAWVNVMPGWKGPRPPPKDLRPAQLYHAHPDWFIQDEQGRRQPLVIVNPKTGQKDSFYVILNPCLPEVRRHITSVVEEIVTRYDVDGIHLDYVRYAWDGTQNAKRGYPRDRRTLALYRRETGKHPDHDASAWDHWRANQLTRLVAEIRAAVRHRRPGATLTAAVWRNPQLGYNEYLQNSVAWLRTGLVDALLPMVYTTDLRQLESDVEAYRALVGDRPLVPGLGIYKHKQPGRMRDQFRHCAQWGGDFALFSYESLYPAVGDRKANKPTRAAKQRLRYMRREVLRDFPPR